jgi:hypothetical protein
VVPVKNKLNNLKIYILRNCCRSVSLTKSGMVEQIIFCEGSLSLEKLPDACLSFNFGKAASFQQMDKKMAEKCRVTLGISVSPIGRHSFLVDFFIFTQQVKTSETLCEMRLTAL